jgi:hypothetical protein
MRRLASAAPGLHEGGDSRNYVFFGGVLAGQYGKTPKNLAKNLVFMS